MKNNFPRKPPRFVGPKPWRKRSELKYHFFKKWSLENPVNRDKIQCLSVKKKQLKPITTK